MPHVLVRQKSERILFNQIFWSRMFYNYRYIDMMQGDEIMASKCTHINNHHLYRIVDIIVKGYKFDDINAK